MVIFVKPDGTTIVSNDSIGVGSHVGMVEIVAPTRAGAFVELLLQLPSGLAIPPEVCAPRSEISSESVGVYTCTLSKSVTSEAGRVIYQVRFTYADGQIELTPGGSFVIQSGVVVILPDEVSDDAYEEIKNLLATINANYAEILERFDRMEEENAELSASLGSAVKQASESAAASINSASQAKDSETNAKASESNAKSSETAASQSAESAAKSAAAAAISETNAKTSEENAKASEKAIEEAKDILSRYPKFTTTVVDALPSSGISINTFYLVKGNESTSDRYVEYMFVPNGEPVAGELYEDTDGHFERIGMQSAEAVSAGAPHFDLTALGLPSTPMTGVSVSVNIDTTEIREALSNGPVKFTLGIANASSTIVVGGYLSGSFYVCTYRIDRDNYLFIRVAAGSVGSAIVYAPALPAISGEDDNGKILTVVDGAWAAAEQEAAAIPFFDLAALGLPDVTMDGMAKELETDTTDIRAALDAGPVKFAFNLEDAGRAELVMNKVSINEYGIYMCIMPFNGGLFSLMIADGDIQVGVAPLITLPDVTSEDNGKIMQVTNGVWSLATPTGGGTEIPTYDLTAMGLPTVEVNGEVVELVTDTTQIMSDLTSRSVKVTFALSMGGEAASVSKIVNALTGDALGGCIVTSTDALGDTVVFTNFNIIEGGIVAMSYTLDTLVNPYIDAYMEDALGGDY